MAMLSISIGYQTCGVKRGSNVSKVSILVQKKDKDQLCLQ